MSKLIITEITDNEHGEDFHGRIELSVSDANLAVLDAHAQGGLL